jgi:SAM-dependent methyltransferase
LDDKKEHWESIYRTKDASELSWTQERPSPSLEWIVDAIPDRSAAIIDIGGGLSPLAEFLLDVGYSRPTVLDISEDAIKTAKERIGKRQSLVDWIVADVTTEKLIRKFTLWHDRAVFHFLTSRADRERYIENVRTSLTAQGKILLATFSPNGPGQCSGLDVMRFDESALSTELGSEFRLLRSARHTHQTPWGRAQEFQYCLFEKQ